MADIWCSRQNCCFKEGLRIDEEMEEDLSDQMEFVWAKVTCLTCSCMGMLVWGSSLGQPLIPVTCVDQEV